MIPVLEAVPNFSEGRDPEFVAAVAEAFARAGCDVLHTTLDPEHHRSVITVIGSPDTVEEGAVAAAALALERIDLRGHQGVHPRVGALDVLPFVPLHGMDMADAVRVARRAGARIGRLGIPVFWYGQASVPSGRRLATIRRGGFEALARGGADGRPAADLPGHGGTGESVHLFAHPRAGAACVGARDILLAWNVDVEGVPPEAAREIAAGIRETGGGFNGLRALAFHLPEQGRLQISMNLENPAVTDPMDVFREIERRVRTLNGRVAGTEVIGMLPDAVPRSVARRMAILDWSPERMLGDRVTAHLAARC